MVRGNSGCERPVSILRRGQSWCRRWAKRRLRMGILDSRRRVLGAPEKLDVDGVGGARLESMAAKAAEWRKPALQESSRRLQCECPSVEKLYLIAFQAQRS